MTVSVDMQQARNVVHIVSVAYANREGILEDTSNLVENQIPRGVTPLSSDHANFLFFTVFNDHGVKSRQLYSHSKRLFESDATLFRASHIVNRFHGEDDESIPRLITTRIGARYPAQAARSWYVNSKLLLDGFGGDAATLFRSFDDARDLLKEIMAFRSYGPKTGGMLVRAIAGLGFARLGGLGKVLVPVDIHDARIAFYTGILRNGAVGESEDPDYRLHVRLVQQTLRDACSELDNSWLNVDRALWLIGSRGCVQLRCHACPLHSVCSVGRARVSNDERAKIGRGS